MIVYPHRSASRIAMDFAAAFSDMLAHIDGM
jgi:hypothetical protein